MSSTDQARTALTQAEAFAAAAVDDTADAHEAFRVATDLARAFRQASDRIAELRGQAAVRIREQESLTLRSLADRIGVSPARAAQLVKTATAREAGSHE